MSVPSSPCDITTSHRRFASRRSVFRFELWTDFAMCVGATIDTFHPISFSRSYASKPQLEASYTPHTSAEPTAFTRASNPSCVGVTVIVCGFSCAFPHTAAIEFRWTSMPTYVTLPMSQLLSPSRTFSTHVRFTKGLALCLHDDYL